MELYQGDMSEYTLSFCTKDADILDDSDNRQYWRCFADDYAHAVEQLKNAEPNMNFCELIKVSK